MIRFVFMLCAIAEGFLLWFLIALIREGRHDATHSSKADRARSEPTGRNGLLLSQETRTQDAWEDQNRLNLTIRVKF
jgi:hypothetical protein